MKETTSNFVHLHVHSDYSLLDGVSKINALIEKAKSLNMKALALTDSGNMFGVLNFEKMCRANGIKPIVGQEFYLANFTHTLVLLCENEIGYKNLCHLSSLGCTVDMHDDKPQIDFEMLRKRHEGLICLSGGIHGEIAQLLLVGKDADAEKVAVRYAELFGKDRFYIEIQNHGLAEEQSLLPKLASLARKLDLPLVATNDVHYCNHDDTEAYDVLRCIGMKKKLNELHETLGEGMGEWYMKSTDEMSAIFAEYPDAISNTAKIADKCHVTIPKYGIHELKNNLPRIPLPEQFSDEDDYLRYLVETGLQKRYDTVTDEIKQRAEFEMSVIFQNGFSRYFLIVWEFINWAKEHGIPTGPGRGSSAGSVVSYAMAITDIDPLRYGLIFERFLNPERVSMPDFDVDIDDEFRDNVIEHVKKLYGDKNVAHITKLSLFKARKALADVGRVLNIPFNEIQMLQNLLPDNFKERLQDAFLPPTDYIPDGGRLIPYKDDPRYKKLFELCFKLENITCNTGLHSSGMVIANTDLSNLVPIYKDQRTYEVGTQYTFSELENCGLVKFDFLGLKTLTQIQKIEELINRNKKSNEAAFRVADVPLDDTATLELFSRGDTEGVFQFESHGMQKSLQCAKPSCIEDLIALNALYRPGPMDFIPQFIEGKFNPKKIQYLAPCLKDILSETYGVIVYQEQEMQIANRVAGFSLGQADILRRTLGKRKADDVASTKEKFIAGAKANGFDKKCASKIFRDLLKFAGYTFVKAHAVSYTTLAYRTAWLKCHYSDEFMEVMSKEYN